MLAQAIEAEVAAWIDDHAHLKDEAGRRQVVRNGHLPRADHPDRHGADRGQAAPSPRPAARRATGDVHLGDPAPLPAEDQEPGGVDPLALPQGRSAPATSPRPSRRSSAPTPRGSRPPPSPGSRRPGRTSIEAWSKRSLAGKHYVYVWADGVHFNIRLEEGRQCILVLMGATAEGKKELIAIADGYRESEQSWKELLLDCKARGLEIEPNLAIGDGALGFWKAMRQVWDDDEGAAVLGPHHPGAIRPWAARDSFRSAASLVAG